MALFSFTSTVLRNLFHKPVTRLYPTRQKEPHRTERTRGHIANAIDACIFCGACAKRCPTDAIIVTKTDREWSIDRLRCCTCNACVEVCPKKCLTMDNRYSPPTQTRDKDVFRQAPVADKPAAP